MNEYTIICPSCDGEMDDTNRISTTVINAFKRRPGGEAYQYVYRCPSCGSTITWTYRVGKPHITIRESYEGEEEA